jgi:hypothetical protein
MSKAVRDPLLPLTHYQRLGKQPSSKKSTPAIWATVILLGILVLAGVFFLQKEIETLKKEANATPQPSLAVEEEVVPTTASPSASAGATEGQACGGITGTACAEGLVCQLEGTYPDAGGYCVKETKPSRTNVIPTVPIRASTAPTAPAGEMTMCTMDSMQCPDGSWVGRSGPNCEFKCPAQ